jgi:hypothetical protein
MYPRISGPLMPATPRLRRPINTKPENMEAFVTASHEFETVALST